MNVFISPRALVGHVRGTAYLVKKYHIFVKYTLLPMVNLNATQFKSFYDVSILTYVCYMKVSYLPR